MRLYVNEAVRVIVGFLTGTVHKVSQVDNALANALAKLAFVVPSVLGESVTMKELHQPIVASHTVLSISSDMSGITPIIQYLLTGDVLPETTSGRSFRLKAIRYTLIDRYLYKRGYSMPLLRCLDEAYAMEVLREAYEGTYSTYAGHQAGVARLLEYSHFWPGMRQQVAQYIWKRDKGQHFTSIDQLPPITIVPIISLIPFA